MNLTHLGTKYGGWKIPLDVLPANAVCYCVGAGEDISFDIELAGDFSRKVYTFDPTPRSADHVKELEEKVAENESMAVNGSSSDTYNISAEDLKDNFQFFPIGVFSDDVKTRFYAPKNTNHVSHSIVNLQKTDSYFEADCRRVKTIMKDLGHQKVDLLKLDIEGAENEVLADMIATKIFPTILCVEFDRALNGMQQSETLDLIHQLLDSGYAIAVEDNWNITFVDQRLCGKFGSMLRLWKFKRSIRRKMRRAARKAAA